MLSSEATYRTRIAPGLSYVGTLDGIWRHRAKGTVILKEWKTAASIWADHLPLDEQAGSYWAFSPPFLRKKGILEPGQFPAAVLYTFLRKAKPDDRPKNELGQALNQNGTVSKRQPAPLFERHLVYRDKFDREMIKGRTLAQAHEMELIRDGKLALTKSPSTQNCKGCPFIDPCELHETGADYRTLLKAAFRRYDPYAAHMIKEEGK